MLKTSREGTVRAWMARLALLAGLLSGLTSASLAQAQWADGFEGYPNGQFPNANWSWSGNNQITVTNATAETGNQSLYLYGRIGGNWAALAHRSINHAPDLVISFSVKNGPEVLSGVHPFYGGLQLNTGNNWIFPARGLIGFGMDGMVHAPASAPGGDISGPVLQSFVAGAWYDVQIHYRVLDASSISLSYWVNGSFDGTYLYPRLSYETSLSYLGLVSGAGSAWFDNVSVSAVPEPGGAGLLLAGMVFFLFWQRKRVLLKLGTALVAMAGLTSASAAPAVVYATPVKNIERVAYEGEWGDVVTLGSTERAITSLSFVTGSWVTGVDTVIVRFYDVGPDGMPSSLVWQSSPMSFDVYYNRNPLPVTLDIPSVPVPTTFAWTLDLVAYPAGNPYPRTLSVGDFPTIGSSPPGFIIRQVGETKFKSIGDDPTIPGPDNIAATITAIAAVPEVPSWLLMAIGGAGVAGVGGRKRRGRTR